MKPKVSDHRAECPPRLDTLYHLNDLLISKTVKRQSLGPSLSAKGSWRCSGGGWGSGRGQGGSQPIHLTPVAWRGCRGAGDALLHSASSHLHELS